MGGAQMRILRTLEYLNELGVMVHIITFKTGVMEKSFTLANASIIVMPVQGILSQALIVNKISKLILNLNPQIIHTHLGAASLYGRLGAFIAKRRGWQGRVITTHHGREKRRYHFFETFLSIINDEIICVSNHVKKDWYSGFAGISVIKGSTLRKSDPDINNLPEIEPAIEKKSFTLGFRGRLVMEKGPDILVNSFIKLVQDGYPLRLIISGEGPLKKSLQNRLKAAGCISSVDMESNFSIHEFYEKIDIFVMPSRTEGQGLSINESMKNRCLCMASRVGGIPETIIDKVNGILFDPDSEKSLMSAVKRFLNMTLNFKNLIIQRAYKDSQCYTSETMNDAIIKLYELDGNLIKPKRVLLVISSSIIGGGERHCLYLARSLSKNWKITVVVSEPGPLYDEFIKLGIKPFCIKMRDNMDFIALYSMVSFIKKGRFDIVHSHLNRASLFSGLACRILGTAHISTVHGLNRKLYYRWSDRIIAVCKAAGNILINSGINKDKIAVIYNAIPDIFIDEKASGETKEFIFGMIGKLHPNKGHEIVIKAVSNLKEKGCNVVVEIAGTGDARYKAKLDTMASNLGIENQIRYLGFQENPINLFKEWRALIIASYKEAFPYVALEAMGQKTLCIASETGGIPELIENNRTGLLFTPGDFKMLEKQMEKALKDDSAYNKMIVNAYKNLTDNYKLNKSIEKIEKEYVKALKK